MRKVVEHKHKMGVKVELLVGPKTQETAKGKGDGGSGTVIGFLQQFGVGNGVKGDSEGKGENLAGG
ncbi:hypothetical protein B1218_34065, partial [Pseudomonas ogarae]